MAGSTGSVTITETNVWGGFKQITFAWVTGTSSQADVAPATATVANYIGRVISFITSPSTSLQPDDNYDITITNTEGHDILNGAGANRSEATTEFAFNGSTGAETFRMIPIVNSQLTFNIINGGTGKAGTAYLTIGM